MAQAPGVYLSALAERGFICHVTTLVNSLTGYLLLDKNSLE